MRITSPVRSVSALLATTCLAALAACSSSNNHGTPDGASPTPDGAVGTTYWLAPRTSEVDLQLVTTQPTQGF
jgi:hypothetical protein